MKAVRVLMFSRIRYSDTVTSFLRSGLKYKVIEFQEFRHSDIPETSRKEIETELEDVWRKEISLGTRTVVEELFAGSGSGDGLESHLTCSAARALSIFQIFIRGKRMIYRNWLSNTMYLLSIGGNRMVLLNVLQRAVSSLNNTSDPPSIEFIEALLQFYLLQAI
ncbi:hypothetical protein Tco_1394447 [Tanacetum coccineum]